MKYKTTKSRTQKNIVPFEPERTCQHITTKENEDYFSFSFNSMFFRETCRDSLISWNYTPIGISLRHYGKQSRHELKTHPRVNRALDEGNFEIWNSEQSKIVSGQTTPRSGGRFHEVWRSTICLLTRIGRII